MYPNGAQWINSTQDSLIIDKREVNATLHEGQWQCKVGNIIGNTTADTVHITVNGKSLVNRNERDYSDVIYLFGFIYRYSFSTTRPL